jgi:uncharacterized repeat protein (TIGR03803 family)
MKPIYLMCALALLLALTYQPSAVSQEVAMRSPRTRYRVLYRFHDDKDGGEPFGGVTLDTAGNLYGTTSTAGSGFGLGLGTVFKLDTAGKLTTLHAFTGNADGGNPFAGVILDTTGNLYGTTNYGGVPDYLGTVFMLDKTGKETVLHNFTGEADGESPFAPLIRDAAGNLYGTTLGKSSGDQGTVFKLDKNGKETVLHNFTGRADGQNPEAGLIRDRVGNLYGTAGGGQLNAGTVFKIDQAGKFTPLYAFSGGTDGSVPLGGLVRDPTGNFYGTTFDGGDLNCNVGFGCGVVFKLDQAGKETVVYRFVGGTDGQGPQGNLVRDTKGNLYGITYFGGSAAGCGGGGCGTVFKLDANGKETILHRFQGTSDGANPMAGLTLVKDGTLYGTTRFGGDAGVLCIGFDDPGCGTVFKITP